MSAIEGSFVLKKALINTELFTIQKKLRIAINQKI